MPDWYAVYSHPQSEAEANEQLQAREFKTFFPHTLEHVGRRVVRRAYYPRYLFVNTEFICLGKVRECPGVHSMVQGTNGMPFRIAQEVIQAVLDISDYLGLIHTSEASLSPYGLHKGKRVRINEGNPFWGLVGTISAIDHKSVSVVLKMLGADRELKLPVGAITPGDNGAVSA